PDARAREAHNEVFDLFAALDATEAQLDFPTVFASGRSGWAVADLAAPRRDLTPLFELILAHVPPPQADPDAPFSMLATTLDYDPYLGRVLTGLIHSGAARLNMPVKSLGRDGHVVEQARLTKLQAFRGLDRRPIEEAQAGDIIAVAGLALTTVADTICAPEVTAPLAADPIDPPTLAMTFSVNDSPLGGHEGDKVTSRMIAERLFREAEGNVAIRVTENRQRDAIEVAGRGELQLGVLIETMRREGYELSISRPRVLMTTDPETGERLEPIEEVVVDVDEEFSGVVVDKMSRRKAEMVEMRPSGGGKLRLAFTAPTRGLIGYHGEFLTDTRGSGVMSRLFHSYAPHRGPIEARRNGVLISTARGVAVAYALWNLEDRGPMFITPGDDVYPGMVIGAHTRGNDLDVNPAKGKQLTNIRTTSKDEAVRLTPPITLSLEEAIAYIADDELVEVTPKAIRLRKRLLDANDRKRASRAAAE
ncbi:MAG: EF-Tu/IF-2/RF-3 family GTPase, partial [Stellaceae bacterium]